MKMKWINSIFRYEIPAGIILCFWGTLLYSQTFQSPFVFDDLPLLENLKAGNLSFSSHLISTRIVSYLSFALNYYLHKESVFGYHLVNLIIHLCSAILVWRLALLTFRTPAMKEEKISGYAPLLSFFIALIFVSHPIQTQAVTYICQRMNSLAAFFYLTALCLYIKARLLKQERPSCRICEFYYFGSLAAMTAAIFTKEIALTLPFALLLYEISFLQRKGDRGWLRLIPFFVILLILLPGLYISGYLNAAKLQNPVAISPQAYLLTQLKVKVTYLRLFFLPFNQNADYDYPVSKSISEPAVLASFIFLTIVFVSAVRMFPKKRLISFAIFWFFLTTLPHSSIIPIPDLIFEHRLYLTTAGYSFFLVCAAYYLFRNKPLRAIIIILSIITVGYSLLTYKRNLVWKDSLTFWGDAISKSPLKSRPYNNRGSAYARAGEYKLAIIDYTKAIELENRQLAACRKAIIHYTENNKPGRAKIYHQKAWSLKRSLTKMCYNRAGVYNELGLFDLAIADYARVKPGFASDDHYNRVASVYMLKGALDEAIKNYNIAISHNPGNPAVYKNRAVAWFLKADYQKSLADVNLAKKLGAKIHPDFLINLEKKISHEDNLGPGTK